LTKPFVDLGELLVEGEEHGAILVRGGEAHRIWKTKGRLCGAQLGRGAGESAIDGDHLYSGRGDELIDDGVGSVLDGTDEDLGVHTGAHEQFVAGGEVLSEEGDGACVLGVGCVQERDQYICVKDYTRHSSRSSSRWPGG
jgi:hypothetical protein